MGKSKGRYGWFKEKILKRYFVRFHMSLILFATIASGVSIGKLLLMIGVTSMAWRYPISVLLAYGVFLLLVRIWVWWVTGIQIQLASGHLDGVDTAVDLGLDLPGGSGGGGGRFAGFGGGSSGGGGASDTFASSLVSDVPVAGGSGGGGSSGGGGWFSNFDLDLDLGDAWWIVLLLAILVLIICGAGGYLVWMAPEILPEVALEVALAGGLAGAAKRLEERGWIGGLVRSTAIPFLVVLIGAGAVGFAIQAACPSATRVMEAMACPEATAGK